MTFRKIVLAQFTGVLLSFFLLWVIFHEDIANAHRLYGAMGDLIKVVSEHKEAMKSWTVEANALSNSILLGLSSHKKTVDELSCGLEAIRFKIRDAIYELDKMEKRLLEHRL